MVLRPLRGITEPTTPTRLAARTTVPLARPDVVAAIAAAGARPGAGAAAGAIAGPGRLVLVPQPVDLLRTDDLLFLRCSFVNLAWATTRPGQPPVLERNVNTRPAFLVVTFPPQHVIEKAFFQTAEGIPTGATNPPEPGKEDPDAAAGSDLPLEVPPVFSSLAASSRLVFRVTNQQIEYTVEGILRAMATLELAVAPHAVPPPPPLVIRPWRDLVSSGQLNLAALTITTAAGAARVRVTDPDLLASNALAFARVNRTAVNMERRFGLDSALQTVAAVRVGELIDLGSIVGIGALLATPPLPVAPGPTETAIELPWRLTVSPNDKAAWAHSPAAVIHGTRVELWHTRLGLRATAKDGTPSVDEIST
ncbi:MAG: hypothetical protein QOD63_257, partial [Actinomycetota bacterium]|nr:hypothetical protein [Actinomycetota bacterium]